MPTAFTRLQHALPQHRLSRFAGRLANSEFRPLAQFLIWFFRRLYRVNLAEAERESVDEYVSFNDFFTRRLKLGVRPIALGDDVLSSPADGFFGSFGNVAEGQVFQAKGVPYSLARLLDCSTDEARHFEGGSFLTVYLSPSDYHRVHMPADGALVSARYIPGELFSVNGTTEADVPGLFARNERLVCHFDSARGPFAIVLVGALIVAGIRAVWADPALGQDGVALGWPVPGDPRGVSLLQGQELGHFELGSTVIVVWQQPVRFQEGMARGQSVRMGARIGLTQSTPDAPATTG